MLIDKAELAAMAIEENQTRVRIQAAYSSPNIPSNRNESAGKPPEEHPCSVTSTTPTGFTLQKIVLRSINNGTKHVPPAGKWGIATISAHYKKPDTPATLESHHEAPQARAGILRSQVENLKPPNQRKGEIGQPNGYVVEDSSRLCAKHFDIYSIFPTPKKRGKNLVQNAKSNCIQQDAEVDFPTHAAVTEDFFYDEFPKYSDFLSDLQLDMNHKDENEHDKQSYSSTVDDMRSISEMKSEDEPMNDSDTENIPEKPKAKRKLKLEGSKDYSSDMEDILFVVAYHNDNEDILYGANNPYDYEVMYDADVSCYTENISLHSVDDAGEEDSFFSGTSTRILDPATLLEDRASPYCLSPATSSAATPEDLETARYVERPCRIPSQRDREYRCLTIEWEVSGTDDWSEEGKDWARSSTPKLDEGSMMVEKQKHEIYVEHEYIHNDLENCKNHSHAASSSSSLVFIQPRLHPA
ncbi:Uncharacterized protein APZ42_031442 [Daphnia magna]|uniref:Uncharacterized protein n=1 Tax=Daphnia magna TaxID=35525 RepID=A0A164MWB8_9CRUS|nr:Uncharacterized protein APZ42_031442 [Daphnia magna]